MRLLLDEMHSPTIGGALSEKGIDVIAVAGEPSLRGLSDADLLDHAAATDRVLVTENLGVFSLLMTRRASAGTAHAGVIFTNPTRFNRASLAYPGNVIAALSKFVACPPITGESWVWWL